MHSILLYVNEARQGLLNCQYKWLFTLTQDSTTDLYCSDDVLVSSDLTDLNNFAGCNNTDIQLVGGRNNFEGPVGVQSL